METYLGQGIELLLDLDPVRGAIIRRNLGYIEKVRTFRSCVNLAVDPKERPKFNETAKSPEAFAAQRNSVAHSPYGESTTSDGLEFYLVDAKRQFKYTTDDWSAFDACGKINALRLMGDSIRSHESAMEFALAAGTLRRLRTEADQTRYSGVHWPTVASVTDGERSPAQVLKRRFDIRVTRIGPTFACLRSDRGWIECQIHFDRQCRHR